MGVIDTLKKENILAFVWEKDNGKFFAYRKLSNGNTIYLGNFIPSDEQIHAILACIRKILLLFKEHKDDKLLKNLVKAKLGFTITDPREYIVSKDNSSIMIRDYEFFNDLGLRYVVVVRNNPEVILDFILSEVLK